MGNQGPASRPESILHTRKAVRVRSDENLVINLTLTRVDSFSILPAPSLDGFLFASIVEGSFNAALFTEFIEVLLEHMNLFPGPNSVIIMDNCRIHKSPLIVDMVERRLALQHPSASKTHGCQGECASNSSPLIPLTSIRSSRHSPPSRPTYEGGVASFVMR